MTIGEALAEAGGIFNKKRMEAPVREAGVLLAFVLNVDISWIYAHSLDVLSPEKTAKYRELVQKRSEGMPFQYISNNQEFMSLNFHVTRDCLIPRADTEVLVETALAWLKRKSPAEANVLDIGTGSGAIAVSLAFHGGNIRIDALELSPNALKLAVENARKHNVDNRIRFIQADFFHWEADEPYSLVLSNPPYIPHGDLKNLMPEVGRYEPRVALDGGKDGLVFYRTIAAKTKRLLKPGGAIFVEVGLGQAEYVRQMLESQGLDSEIYQDLSGISRVVRGEWIVAK